MGIPLIVTGMHRSGTSLLANLLQEAGLFIGERLKAPTAHNVKGHFEDLDFVELHDAILAANGTSMYLENHAGPLVVGPEHRARAQSLVAARAHQPIWGWKDPRTTLFLDFWLELLPGARYVFIFRPPEQVVDSLRRRSERQVYHQFWGAWLLRRLGFSMFRLQLAIELWLRYNREVVQFATRRPERSCVLDLEALAVQMPAALRRMRAEWGLCVKDVPVSAVLEKELLHAGAPPDLTKACRRHPDVAPLYDQLRRLAGA